jgi:hypothetical protein
MTASDGSPDSSSAPEGVSGHVSDSAVQRKAEGVIRERLAELLGTPLKAGPVTLAGGATVEVDAVSTEDPVLAEIFARQGALKAGQQKKVAIDTLKLITIRRERPETRLLLAFADEAAAAYAQGNGWLANALRSWEVDVVVVAIPDELRAEIRAAQAGQRMINVDEVADDIVALEEP